MGEKCKNVLDSNKEIVFVGHDLQPFNPRLSSSDVFVP